MKVSKYNIVIPYKKYLILYNTLWNSVVVIYRKDRAKWGIDSNYNLLLPNVEPRFIDVLREKHIILNDKVDEKLYITSIMSETNNKKDMLELTIIPSLACNFSCWYCYEKHNTTESMSKIDIKRIVLAIQRIAKDHPEINTLKIDFFGGEPLLYFKSVIVPLINAIELDAKLDNLSFKVGFTTNGYLISKDFIDFFTKKHILESLQITLDGNKKQHNKVRFSYRDENTYSIIVRNIKECIKNKINIVLRLNISKDTSLNIETLLNEFNDVKEAKRYLHISIQKVWQSDKSVYDTIEQLLSKSRSLGFDSASYFTFPSSIWSTCYSDKQNHMVINPKGILFKCTARDFSRDQIEGYITEKGEIKWNKLHEKRIQMSSINNDDCVSCNLFPICAGGCSQKALEGKIGNHCSLYGNTKLKTDYARRVLVEKIELGKYNKDK